MDIQLVRTDRNSWGIDGRLYINRSLVCDTVEHPARHLPAGQYIISSFDASGICPSDDSCVLIPFPFRHGDGALLLRHGEIIVGKQLISGLVTQSQPTYERLYERLKKALQRHTTIRFTICGS